MVLTSFHGVLDTIVAAPFARRRKVLVAFDNAQCIDSLFGLKRVFRGVRKAGGTDDRATETGSDAVTNTR